jgi:hypothetical protein
LSGNYVAAKLICLIKAVLDIGGGSQQSLPYRLYSCVYACLSALHVLLELGGSLEFPLNKGLMILNRVMTVLHHFIDLDSVSLELLIEVSTSVDTVL